ncbi:Hypothetical predicted protein [Olea europaea subsp. europaea]|uniref:Uncharacterized protein n=2 Tax=Olea europaea subsp. europaea TaxID=158383 RepID=A0A8S0TR50_OLEEU|nr:Hypothetical predicted protein [Olea europaea subsp. europaea]
MSKPSSSRFVYRYLHLTAFKPTSDNPSTVQILTFRARLISARTHLSSLPNMKRIFDRLYPDAKFSPNRDFDGFRCFSLKNEMGSENLAKDALKNPVVAVKDNFLWYKEAFWKRKLSGVAGSMCSFITFAYDM